MAVYFDRLDRTLMEVLRLGATDVWDFTRDQYWRAGALGASGVSITRASSGYAETAAGTLVNFGSGVLRRTDRGVLIEGARTNLLTRSQAFDDASWTKNNVTVTADATTAPDGTTTADLVYPATTGASRGIYQAVSGSSAAYTHSFFLKAAGKTVAAMIGITGTSATATYFDLSAGTIGNVGTGQTAAIQALGNGWYRCSITSTDVPAFVEVRIVDANGSLSVTANGTDGIFLWGAQLEAAAFASSYIPTAASTVTRAADEVTATTPSTGGPLSLYVEAGPKQATGSFAPIGVEWSDNTVNNRVGLYASLTLNDQWRTFSVDGGSGQADQQSGTYTAAVQKIASRYATNDIRAAVDGTLGTADTTCTIPAGLTTFRIANGVQGSGTHSFGYLRRAAIFPSALSDAQLQAITT
jgi:hypothetical protein